MSRKFYKITDKTEVITLDAAFYNSPQTWLLHNANIYQVPWLLAHADNGVIWGNVEAEALVLSNTPSPAFNLDYLQQLWLFGEKAELYIWRHQTGFKGRLITEVATDEEDCLREDYLLWGTHLEREQPPFSLVTEGQHGLKQMLPLSLQATETRLTARVYLTLHHYLKDDEDGQAYIKLSRLVRLHQGEPHV